MTQILALDPSLTATGIAAIIDGELNTATIASKPSGGTIEDRWERINGIRAAIAISSGIGERYDLGVIEAPSYGSHGAGMHERAALWWSLAEFLLGKCQRVVEVPPSTLKKYATGKGNADKTAMAISAAKRLPVDLDGCDDNAVDAAWLAALGADLLGSPIVSLPAAQVAAISKIRSAVVDEVTR